MGTGPRDILLQLVIVERRREAEGIVSLRLAAKDGGDLPYFEPGAHIDVYAAPGVIRQYSLSNDPALRDHYRIGVLLEDTSRGGSRAMHRLKAGDTLMVGPPRNNFPLRPHLGRIILAAGGIGVTPLIAMAHRLHRLGSDFELHYCGRALRRMAFREELLNSPFAPNVRFHADDGDAKQRFSPFDVFGNLGKDVALYVCGPAGFMNFIVSSAQKQGVNEAAIHLEHFSPLTDGLAGGTAFTVELARSGLQVPVPANMSIAQALLAAGVELDISCEQGMCGTCLTPVLAGTPDHRDSYQTDEEKSKNSHIILCCSRAKSSTLTLYL